MLTMLPRIQCLLHKLLVLMRAYDDELDIVVGKEVIGGTVVLGFGEVDSAVTPSFCVRRPRSPLQKGVDVEFLVWEDEGEVETLC